MAATGAQKDEAGWTGETGRPNSWAMFDALPVGVKRLYWSAPYDYTARGAYRAMVNGRDLRQLVKRQALAMARDLQREVRRLYGASHPQARA